MSETTLHPVTASSARRRWPLLVAAAVVPLATSTIWYAVFGGAYAALLAAHGLPLPSGEPAVWQVVGQLARNGVVVAALAVLMGRLGVTDGAGAARVGLLVWLGFQAMEVFGSVLHEQYPVGLYLIHIGDALQTTLVMALLVARAGARRRSATPR
jgi:Protein of unknown function (DUF1761)